MKTKLKKVTYNGLIYTVDDESTMIQYYKLSGIGWVKKEDCTHWLSGWLRKFFRADILKLFLIICGIYLGWQIGNLFKLIF